MKKLFVIFLSLCYLVLSSGFTQYAHLCKGTASKVYSFSNTQQQNQDKPCPICSAKEKGLKDQKKNCCKHVSKLIKLDDSVKKQSHFDFSVKFWGDAIPNKLLGTVFDVVLIETETTKSPLYSSTKIPVRDNPLYILHCVYRI